MASTPDRNPLLPPLTLHVHPSTGLINQDLFVFLPAHPSTPIYEVLGGTSSAWTVQSPTSPFPIAHVLFQGYHSADITIYPRPRFSVSFGQPFASVGGEMLKWRTRHATMHGRLTLEDEGGGRVAEYKVDSVLFSKKATVVVERGEVGKGELEEIVVTGLVVVDLLRRRRNAD